MTVAQHIFVGGICLFMFGMAVLMAMMNRPLRDREDTRSEQEN